MTDKNMIDKEKLMNTIKDFVDNLELKTQNSNSYNNYTTYMMDVGRASGANFVWNMLDIGRFDIKPPQDLTDSLNARIKRYETQNSDKLPYREQLEYRGKIKGLKEALNEIENLQKN